MDPSSIKALAFDVFGTVVDWRDSIIEEGARLNEERGLNVDWAHFADAWRAEYQPSMSRVREGEIAWTTLDVLHRESLERLLERYAVDGLSGDEKEHLNRVWHRLKPWPDAIPGLTRLKNHFIIATLSNGNVALLVNMAKHAKLPWDCILSAELARAYKPDPKAYQTSAELLGLRVDEVMMVAAHQSDLLAAGRAGMRMAFVPRPLEFGPDQIPDLAPDPSFDLVADDFVDLARKLGA